MPTGGEATTQIALFYSDFFRTCLVSRILISQNRKKYKRTGHGIDAPSQKQKKIWVMKYFLISSLLLVTVERKDRREGHLSLGRSDMALPKMMKNQALQSFFFLFMRVNATKYCHLLLSLRTVVRWEVSQCPLSPGTGMWGSIRLWGFHTSDMGLSQPGNTPRALELPQESGSCPVLALTSSAREGFLLT